jgi:hypothetical protein
VELLDIKRGTYVCTEKAECGRLIIHMKSSYYSLPFHSFFLFSPFLLFLHHFLCSKNVVNLLPLKKNSLNERTIFHVLWNFYFKRWIFQTFPFCSSFPF